VVIPVYNSETALPELARRLSEVLPPRGDFEVVLVNDGSMDGSWQVLQELSSEHSWLRGVNLMRNYGQHNALLCGIRMARYDRIVTMDDDLQNPPEEIPKLLSMLDQGLDVVYGKPERMRHGLLRKLASNITKIVLQRAMGSETARHISAFRAFRTRLRDAFGRYESHLVSIDVLLTWGTNRFGSVEVKHDSRKHGESNYTMCRLVVHALNMLTGFSTLPLRLATVVGFGFTLFGLCVLAYVLGRYLIEGGSVPGFPFLASAIAIFSGAQLFALGILGEYLGRIHMRMLARPPYVVESATPALGE
jgi:undecaprenyl-phosphate 4-deoxy-4-formamido-L-arabinose transferase